ncbi:MAG: hypothetical protein M3160_10185, partial [Candidatus Eremiobacteraeota bacterium]|nr:hypothetical protein [Candidatus Eremiobacteraeota bacterium]
MPLADERTLEALDFYAIRQWVVEETRTQRGARRAKGLFPITDFPRVCREQAATAQVREVISQHDFFIAAAVDTESFTAAATRGSSLGAADLRAIADALASAHAACRRAREQKHEALEKITAGFVALPRLQEEIINAIGERAEVQDRASPLL